MPACAPAWPGRSVRQGQADDGIIGDGGDGLKGHVAGALDGPLVVLFEEDCSDEACDGGLVGEDADDLGAALDLAVYPLERIGNRYEASGASVSAVCLLGGGVCCEHPGQRLREHEGAGRPMYSMSFELALVDGRLCDSPGCAV